MIQQEYDALKYLHDLVEASAKRIESFKIGGKASKLISAKKRLNEAVGFIKKSKYSPTIEGQKLVDSLAEELMTLSSLISIVKSDNSTPVKTIKAAKRQIEINQRSLADSLALEAEKHYKPKDETPKKWSNLADFGKDLKEQEAERTKREVEENNRKITAAALSNKRFGQIEDMISYYKENPQEFETSTPSDTQWKAFRADVFVIFENWWRMPASMKAVQEVYPGYIFENQRIAAISSKIEPGSPEYHEIVERILSAIKGKHNLKLVNMNDIGVPPKGRPNVMRVTGNTHVFYIWLAAINMVNAAHFPPIKSINFPQVAPEEKKQSTVPINALKERRLQVEEQINKELSPLHSQLEALHSLKAKLIESIKQLKERRPDVEKRLAVLNNYLSTLDKLMANPDTIISHLEEQKHIYGKKDIARNILMGTNKESQLIEIYEKDLGDILDLFDAMSNVLIGLDPAHVNSVNPSIEREKRMHNVITLVKSLPKGKLAEGIGKRLQDAKAEKDKKEGELIALKTGDPTKDDNSIERIGVDRLSATLDKTRQDIARMERLIERRKEEIIQHSIKRKK